MQQFSLEVLAALHRLHNLPIPSINVHLYGKTVHGDDWAGKPVKLKNRDAWHSPRISLELGKLHRMGLVHKIHHPKSPQNPAPTHRKISPKGINTLMQLAEDIVTVQGGVSINYKYDSPLQMSR